MEIPQSEGQEEGQEVNPPQAMKKKPQGLSEKTIRRMAALWVRRLAELDADLPHAYATVALEAVQTIESLEEMMKDFE